MLVVSNTVSNTSPIANLAFINRLGLLPGQFERLWIPEAVRSELGRIPAPTARASHRADEPDGVAEVPAYRKLVVGRSALKGTGPR